MPTFDVQTYLEGHILPGLNQNAGQVMQMMQERGIERALLISARAAQVDPQSGNRILKAMLDQSEGLYGALTAHLNRVDSSLQAIKELLNHRKFLAVLLTATDRHTPLPPLLADEILNSCRRYHKPILVHTPNAACVQAALHLAQNYTTHKFVFLGMGGSDWRGAIAAAHSAVNIYLETSGPLDRSKIPAAIASVGAHRVLFGSGMPYLDPAAALGLLEDSEIAPADKRRIVHENAARLFNIAELEAV